MSVSRTFAAAMAALLVIGLCPRDGRAAESTIQRGMLRLLQAAAPKAGGRVGFGDVRDGVTNTPCDPLSTVLTDELTGGVRLSPAKLRPVSYEYITEVDYVVVGEWRRTSRVSLSLDVSLLAPRDEFNVTEVAKESIRVDVDALPPAALRCLLEVLPSGEQKRSLGRIAVYSAPSLQAKVAAEVVPDEELTVVGRVRGEDWLVVRLADDRKLPAGIRERRGFIGRASSGSALVDARGTPGAPAGKNVLDQSIK